MAGWLEEYFISIYYPSRHLPTAPPSACRANYTQQYHLLQGVGVTLTTHQLPFVLQLLAPSLFNKDQACTEWKNVLSFTLSDLRRKGAHV